jgi:hypothetical protein
MLPLSVQFSLLLVIFSLLSPFGPLVDSSIVPFSNPFSAFVPPLGLPGLFVLFPLLLLQFKRVPVLPFLKEPVPKTNNYATQYRASESLPELHLRLLSTVNRSTRGVVYLSTWCD